MVVDPWSFIVDLPIYPLNTWGISQFMSVWMISEWPFHWSKDWLWNLLVNCRFLQNLSGLRLHLCTRISEKKQLPETMVSGGGSTYHLDHHWREVFHFLGGWMGMGLLHTHVRYDILWPWFPSKGCSTAKSFYVKFTSWNMSELDRNT